MKPWAIVLTAAVLLSLALLANWYINRTADTLLATLGDLRSGLERENWPLVDSRVAAVERDWDGIISYWQMLINHREIDSIDQSLVRMKEFTVVRDKANSLNELAVLMKIIGHIPKRDAPVLGNIL